MQDRILNVKQAGELLGISENTLRWHRFNGTGPLSFKIGKRIAYRESDITAYIEAQIDEEKKRLAGLGN